MENRSGRLSLESMVFFGLASVLLFAFAFGIEMPLGPDAASGVRFDIDREFELVYGIIFGALAIASMALAKSGHNSLVGEIIGSSHRRRSVAASISGGSSRVAEADREPWALVWIAVSIVIGAILGLRFIGQPMRYDEAYMFIFFVNGAWQDLFYYPLPNNHIFYGLLEKLFVLIFGQDPLVLRLPALLFNLASIVVVFRLCRKLIGPHGGYLASLCIAVCPFLVMYSTSARGYSLLVLLTLLIISVAVDSLNDSRRVKLAWVSAIAALGMLTMPTMLYAIAGLGLWLGCVYFLDSRSFKAVMIEFVIPGMALILLFTALLYLPVLLANRPSSIADSRFIAAMSYGAFIEGIAPHFELTYNDFTRDIGVIYMIGLGMLLAIGIAVAAKRENKTLLILLPAVLAGSLMLFFLKGSIPYSRTWIYLIPVILIVVDTGFAFLLARLPAIWRVVVLVAFNIGAIGYAFNLMGASAIERYPDLGAAPGASAMAFEVNGIVGADDWLCAHAPVDVLTLYYLWRDHSLPNSRSPLGIGQVFYIVSGKFSDTDSVRETDLTLIREIAGLTLYRLKAPLPYEEFSQSFHCWSRAGP